MSEAGYTYRIRIANRERVQVDKLNPNKQSLGQPDGLFGYHGALRQEIDNLVNQSHAGSLQENGVVKALGEALFNALFDAGLRQDFVSTYNQVVHDEHKLLRIELDIDEAQLPDVAALPWEFMRVPAAANLGVIWLSTATNLVFSRRRSHWFAPRAMQLPPGEKLRIGVAVAAPPDLGPLMHEEEIAALKQAIGDSPTQFELLPVLLDANPVKLDGLLAQRPHIFHFIGHGRLQQTDHGAESQLALVHSTFGNADWVEAEFFSELFNTYRPAIVLLQSCEGARLDTAQAFVDAAAKIVRQNVPVVVAMQYPVMNITSIRFSARFYEEVANGRPVDQAAQSGRRLLALQSRYRQRDFATPVLFMRVEDGHLFAQPDVVETTDESAAFSDSKTSESSEYYKVAVPLTKDAKHIRRILLDHFNLMEINDLCYDLHIDPASISGQTPSEKATQLVLRMTRHLQLDRLFNTIANKRPELVNDLRANFYLIIQSANTSLLNGVPINEEELIKICQELQLDCHQLKLTRTGLMGYSANSHISMARTRDLQDEMVRQGRYPELVAAVKKRLPSIDFSIFET
jgi:hypothetical protein